MTARPVSMALAGLLALATWTAAPFAVNRQMRGISSPSMHYNVGVQPWQKTNMLPSEARMITHASGELPSTPRMNAIAVGPMAPEGNIASVLPRPSGAGPRNVKQGNFIPTGAPPAYVPRAGPPPATASPFTSSISGGSIRYSGSIAPQVPGNFAAPSLAPTGATPGTDAGFQTSVLPWASIGSVSYSQ
jgi:hypothetical protein